MAYARVYPGIGLGRVGNSPTEIFIGPEAPYAVRSLEDPWNPADREVFSYKDAQNRIKRQAARFRVFLYDEDQRGKGYYAKPSKELTLDDDEVKSIVWKVTLANKKAAQYDFMVFNKSTTKLRNPTVKDRSSLKITPSPHTIGGRNVNFHGGDPGLQFDDGSFLGREVNLGELRTDPAGRLVVCGGHGKSEVLHGGPQLTVDPFNNDGWYDDTSDGPVQCTIHFKNGERIFAERASVQFCPPKYAPNIYAAVSFYDVMKEIAEERGYLHGRQRDCVFYRDIYPIISSAVQHSWVSKEGFSGHQKGLATLEIPDFDFRATSYGPGKALSNVSPKTQQEKDYIERRMNELNSNAKLRRQTFKRLRIPRQIATPQEKEAQGNELFMPLPADQDVHLTLGQYRKIEMWANGDFTVGKPKEFRGTLNSGDATKDIPLCDQPAAIDKAVHLHSTGNALNPGIEFGNEMTFARTYKSAFRVNEQVVGPGDIGKKMAVPWQADFWACFMNWWPTSRPEYVVPAKKYAEQGAAASCDSLERDHWDRGFKGMVDLQKDDNWAKLGFVVPMEGRDGHRVYVESQRDPILEATLGDDPPVHPDLPYIMELLESRQHSTL